MDKQITGVKDYMQLSDIKLGQLAETSVHAASQGTGTGDRRHRR